jgi:hypothetical protein
LYYKLRTKEPKSGFLYILIGIGEGSSGVFIH